MPATVGVLGPARCRHARTDLRHPTGCPEKAPVHGCPGPDTPGPPGVQPAASGAQPSPHLQDVGAAAEAGHGATAVLGHTRASGRGDDGGAGGDVDGADAVAARPHNVHDWGEGVRGAKGKGLGGASSADERSASRLHLAEPKTKRNGGLSARRACRAGGGVPGAALASPHADPVQTQDQRTVVRCVDLHPQLHHGLSQARNLLRRLALRARPGPGESAGVPGRGKRGEMRRRAGKPRSPAGSRSRGRHGGVGRPGRQITLHLDGKNIPGTCMRPHPRLPHTHLGSEQHQEGSELGGLGAGNQAVQDVTAGGKCQVLPPDQALQALRGGPG